MIYFICVLCGALLVLFVQCTIDFILYCVRKYKRFNALEEEVFILKRKLNRIESNLHYNFWSLKSEKE